MVILKLSIKPFINSYMLPCACNKEEWDSLTTIFQQKLQKETEGKQADAGTMLKVRPDGFAILEGDFPREFKLSQAGVEALNLREQWKEGNYSHEEIVMKISHQLGVSSFQTEAFFQLVQKWVKNANITFIKPIDNQQGERAMPLLIQWDITAACNLRCVHCYMDASTHPVEKELTIQEMEALIHRFAGYGVLSIHLLGGEPFTRPDILQIIDAITSHSMFCYISTNGTLLTADIIKHLAKVPRLTVDVSLDGVCPRSHDSFRGVKGTFDTVIGTIKQLLAKNIETNVTSVLGNHNFAEIESLIDLAVKLGVKRIQFLTFAPTGRGTEAIQKYGFEAAQLESVRKKLMNLILKYWADIYIDAPMIGCSLIALRVWEVLAYQGFDMYYNVLVGCNAGISKVALDPQGNVLLCPQARQAFGNVRELDFLAVWEKVYSYCQTQKNCPNMNCKYINFCGGKCRI